MMTHLSDLLLKGSQSAAATLPDWASKRPPPDALGLSTQFQRDSPNYIALHCFPFLRGQGRRPESSIDQRLFLALQSGITPRNAQGIMWDARDQIRVCLCLTKAIFK